MSWKHRKQLLLVDEALQKNDYAVAERILSEVIERDSSYVEAFFHRALIRLRLDRSEDAMRDAEISVEKRPENGVAHMIRGEVLLYQKRYLDAFQSLKTSVSLERDNGRAYYYLAKACLGLGRREDAADYLEIALQFEKDFVQAQVAVDQIRV